MDVEWDSTVDAIGLEVGIKGGALVIALPLEALQMAVECYSFFEEYDPDTGTLHEPILTDAMRFAQEVIRALDDESEDGSTLVTRMLNAAFSKALESGAGGILLPADAQYPREAKANRDPAADTGANSQSLKHRSTSIERIDAQQTHSAYLGRGGRPDHGPTDAHRRTPAVSEPIAADRPARG